MSKELKTLINKTWPDGQVLVVKTCCGFEHPDQLGNHVGVHGRHPYWIKIDLGEGGKWCNVGHVSPSIDIACQKIWPEYAEVADSLSDFLAAIGFERVDQGVEQIY